MPRTALYPGSFDPLTNGHCDIIRAAMALCDTLVIGLGVHPKKSPMLTAETRIGLIGTEAGAMAHAAGCRLRVIRFSGLVVDAAREAGASILVRGLRSSFDFEDEIVMAGMNRTLAPDIHTIFVPASPGTRHITGTMVRQIAALGGDVSPFVPTSVLKALADIR